jgi:rhamnose transport system permease protein
MKSAARSLLLNRDFGLGILTVILLGSVTVFHPQFGTLTSLKGVFDDTSVLILLALAQMPVLLTRSVDLSVAANLALSGMCVATFNHFHPQASIVWVMLLAVGIGAALGAVNGLLVWLLELPSIVTTLGTMAIYRGLVFIVSGGAWVTSDKMSPGFLNLMRTHLFGFSALSWLAVLCAIAAFVGLNYTQSGRRFFIAGSNPEAAVYAGIDVRRVRFRAFTLSGAVAGLCGYLWVSRFAVAYTDVAQGFELQVIAACVIGGVSIAGGVGTVGGVVIGCLFLGIIMNALPMIGISPFWQMGVSGLVIVTAVVLNAWTARDVSRRILEEPTT